MTSKNIFVTVGTTRFDDLCKTVVTRECLEVFKKLGYSHVTIQIGNSEPYPDNFTTAGVSVTAYRLKESIIEDISNADLVISHAGAGTCLEVLDLGKPLLVVINTELMDNHQLEIAEQLHDDGHLHYCTCETLLSTLQDSDFTNLKPYPKANTSMFYNYLYKRLGVQP